MWGASSQVLEHAARLWPVSALSGVHRPHHGEMRAILPRVLAALHLAVNDPRVLPLAVDVVHLCQVGRLLAWDNGHTSMLK